MALFSTVVKYDPRNRFIKQYSFKSKHGLYFKFSFTNSSEKYNSGFKILHVFTVPINYYNMPSLYERSIISVEVVIVKI